MQLLQHFKNLTLHPKNAKELKGLILQLAIQGKLTANWRKDNPEVEPSSELLKKIEKEKAQLIKEKKISREKSVHTISEENFPYTLPNTWQWTYLIELSSINGGFAFKSTNYIEDGVRVIRISDFDENGFKNHKVVRHSFSNDLSSYILESKNILIAMTGGTVGKSLFVDSISEKMVVNQRVATVKIFKSIYEKYINCVIPTPLIQNVINEAKNSTNDNISMSDIKYFTIPLPPLEEQKEIVRVVEILFKEVEQLEQLTKERIALKEDFVTSALRQLTTEDTSKEWDYLQDHFKSFFTEKSAVKKLREAVLQLAVQGKLTVDWRKNNPDTETATELLKRIQKEKVQLIKDKKIKKESPLPPISDDEIPYELPESWVWCRLGDTLLFSDAGKSPDCEKRPVVNKEWGVLTTTSIQKNKFNQNANKVLPANYQINVNQIVEIGDILITRAGPINRTGIACKVDEMNFNLILSDKTIRLQYLKDLLSPDFIVSTLNSDLIRGLLLSKMIGMASSQVNISQSNIKNIQFPFPPIEEQKAIVEKVNALMLLCDQLEQEIEESKNLNEQLMKSVLREVFTDKKEMENV
ncbi:type I restriction enzyme, S subunit [Kaistella chaponensis]|uniref:Type I restriction enzyme, S subunit n=1 Tax=Kaistella chaponensis TaxID=713588 RepID=A0A1N7M289_9FLAO|nr:restriction endonuclease subunit S [Kaistella chaponensis]SIS80220.1 type I restriction enzyme, S subunit [Kaistella chaponensis]